MLHRPCRFSPPARGAWGVHTRQYPGEKEITFPPYTCLEAHGDAHLERDAEGNEVIIFPLKVSPHCQSTGIGCCRRATHVEEKNRGFKCLSTGGKAKV